MSKQDIYNKKAEQINETVACTNKSLTSEFISKMVPIINCNMDFGQFFASPLEAGKRIIDYLSKIEDRSGTIHALHNPMYYNILYPLCELSFSHMLEPGKEIRPSCAWQVLEFENMQFCDYKKVIDFGFDRLKTELLKNAFVNRYDDYLEYKADFPISQRLAHEYMRQKNFVDLTNVCPFVSTPFEMLVGARSVKNFFYDCYTQLPIVSDCLEAMWPDVKADYERQFDNYCEHLPFNGVLVGCWRCGPMMINKKLFDILVWPYLKQLGEMIIEKGFVPIFHLDMNWDREIERFKDLPEHKIIINLDGATDIRRTRKLLGEDYCLLGDVPASLMLSANEEEISDYVRSLVGDLGTKGMIYGCGCESPVGTTTEKFIALYSTLNSLG